MNGFLVVDKPAGITSHDVVAAVRAVTGVKKVGHTGTLDPFATGVLALGLGGATRLMQYLDESVKIYDATIALGSATDTGDPTGEVIRELPIPSLDEDGVREVLEGFLGDRDQVPPPYSAVKFKGKPLYWYARRGETVEVPPRRIHVSAIDLVELTPTSVRVTITCSRGTYARVLADEIATALGTAGHLSALARHRSGPFVLDDALTMDTLGELAAETPGTPWQKVLMGRKGDERVPWKPRDVVRDALKPWIRTPLACFPDFPILDVDAATADRVAHGQLPAGLPSGVGLGGRYLVVHGADLVALAEAAARGPKILRVVSDLSAVRRA